MTLLITLALVASLLIGVSVGIALTMPLIERVRQSGWNNGYMFAQKEALKRTEQTTI